MSHINRRAHGQCLIASATFHFHTCHSHGIGFHMHERDRERGFFSFLMLPLLTVSSMKVHSLHTPNVQKYKACAGMLLLQKVVVFMIERRGRCYQQQMRLQQNKCTKMKRMEGGERHVTKQSKAPTCIHRRCKVCAGRRVSCRRAVYGRSVCRKQRETKHQ